MNNKNNKIALAHNTSTPAEVLCTLAKDKDYHVRREVARNTSTPAEVLCTLAKDEDWTIRSEANANMNKNKPRADRNAYTGVKKAPTSHLQNKRDDGKGKPSGR